MDTLKIKRQRSFAFRRVRGYLLTIRTGCQFVKVSVSSLEVVSCDNTRHYYHYSFIIITVNNLENSV
jgi:hypothetical protein